MDNIKVLLAKLNDAARALSSQATEADEFVACSKLEAAIDQAEETFKRTKDIKDGE